ncbi:MAG: phosphatase PAP2 family protein [Deltaproteobacteria bacterium]|nr:phosphatase PAP2 family protein [Deltaproteobacteria bacterium]
MSALARTFDSVSRFERLSLRWIAQRRHPLLDLVMRGFTRAGNWQTWTALIITALIAGDLLRAIALHITPRLLLTLGVAFVIKSILKRPRPSRAMVDFSSLLTDPDPYSFPSSHSACAWVVCISLASLLGGWPLWIAYACAISYSRIHLGAHYPLDVLIGCLWSGHAAVFS